MSLQVLGLCSRVFVSDWALGLQKRIDLHVILLKA